MTTADLLDTKDVPIVFNWDETLNANPEGHNQYTAGGGFHVHQPNVLRARAGINEYRIGYDEKSGQHHVQTARVRPNGKLERPQLLGKFDNLQEAKDTVIAHGRSKGRELVGNADDDVQWITVGGAHIPIGKGQDKDAVVKAHFERIKSQQARTSSTTGKEQEGEGEHGDKPSKFGSAADRARMAQAGATDTHATAMKDIPSALASVKQASSHIAGLKAALGQKVWDNMSAPQQAGYTALKAGVDKVEHALEGHFKSGQNAAREVMKAQGMNEHHIETAGRLLGIADSFARNVSNIPLAHEAIHVLTHIGGPIGFLGAKAGYYTPVASLAYVGASLAKAAVGDIARGAGRAIGRKDPFQTIKIARAAIRGIMQKQEPHGDATHGAIAHGVAGAMHLSKSTHNAAKSSMGENANLLAPALKEHITNDDIDPHYEALLYAALDETRGDMKRSIQLANKVHAT